MRRRQDGFLIFKYRQRSPLDVAPALALERDNRDRHRHQRGSSRPAPRLVINVDHRIVGIISLCVS
jgi:hypothetical protein